MEYSDKSRGSVANDETEWSHDTFVFFNDKMNTPQDPKIGGLAAALDAVRKELLDLGLRNPLLNYRALKSRGLEFDQARGSDIYKALLGGGKHFSFRALEDRQDRSGKTIFDGDAADSNGGPIETALHTALTGK
jgi:hypothetical protein